MANINIESKGPKGPCCTESLQPAAIPLQRGLGVTYGADEFHAALQTTPGAQCIGLVEEDAVSLQLPIAVVEFGEHVAQIGATVAPLQALAVNALGQLVPAQPGQHVVAIAIDGNPNAGDYVTVFVVALCGIVLPGSAVTYVGAAGALPVATGTYAIDGAAALALTLAAPATPAQDGTTIKIFAQTAHAHTVTTPAAGIYGTKHVITFAAEGDGVELVAVGGTWMVAAISGPTPAALS